MFTDAFGARPGADNWEPGFDLDQDNRVDFENFLLFVGLRGKY